MKKAILFIVLLLPMAAWAQDVKIDGIFYILDKEAKTAKVTNHVIYDKYGMEIDRETYHGDVEIPSTIESDGLTYKVTSIGASAFYLSFDMTSVKIPTSVTTIGTNAFGVCRSLASVSIPDSVTNIGDWAFSSCENLVSVTVPNSVTTIGKRAFAGCSSLSSFKIPESITTLENELFKDCTSLESITIPANVTTILSGAFSGCTALSSFTIPETVTNLSASIFSGCSGLKAVTYPQNTTRIEWFTFDGCSNLTSFKIPDGVTQIGGSAFNGCSSLAAITIPNGVTDIEQLAFQNCSSLTDIVIPENVVNIEQGAFNGCTGIKSVRSYIKEPYSVNKLFANETYRNATLYVPAGTKELYIRFDGWREFLKIEEMDETDTLTGHQCATPEITFKDNKLHIECETPGAVFTSSITAIAEEQTGNELPIVPQTLTYTITVYATAPGYDRSQPVKMKFTLSQGDVNADGRINVADISAIIDLMAGNKTEE